MAYHTGKIAYRKSRTETLGWDPGAETLEWDFLPLPIMKHLC